jgi:hypothetical protein
VCWITPLEYSKFSGRCISLALSRDIRKLVGEIILSPNKRAVVTTKGAFTCHGVVFFAAFHELATPHDQIIRVGGGVSVG